MSKERSGELMGVAAYSGSPYAAHSLPTRKVTPIDYLICGHGESQDNHPCANLLIGYSRASRITSHVNVHGLGRGSRFRQGNSYVDLENVEVSTDTGDYLAVSGSISSTKDESSSCRPVFVPATFWWGFANWSGVMFTDGKASRIDCRSPLALTAE